MDMGLFDRGARLRLLPEQGAYLPGEVVTVWVSLHGTEDLDVRDGRVELRSVHRYTYSTVWQDSEGDTRRSDLTRTDEETVDEQPFLDHGPLAAHSPFERAVSFRLPDRARPSGTGTIAATAWQVRARIAVAQGLDLRADAPITVLAPRKLHQRSVKRRATVQSDGSCDLSLTFPRREIRAGDVLRGTFTLMARRELEARGMRIELIRHELVKPPPEADAGAASNSDDTVVAEATVSHYLQLWPGEARTLPFELPVPDDAHPTARTKRCAVRWLLKGTVDRYLRDDDTIVQEILCYNGSPTAAVAPTFP